MTRGKYFPAIHGEHWIYALAGVIAIFWLVVFII